MKEIKPNSLKCLECGKCQSSYVSSDEHAQKIIIHCDNCGNEWMVPNTFTVDAVLWLMNRVEELEKKLQGQNRK